MPHHVMYVTFAQVQLHSQHIHEVKDQHCLLPFEGSLVGPTREMCWFIIPSRPKFGFVLESLLFIHSCTKEVCSARSASCHPLCRTLSIKPSARKLCTQPVFSFIKWRNVLSCLKVTSCTFSHHEVTVQT